MCRAAVAAVYNQGRAVMLADFAQNVNEPVRRCALWHFAFATFTLKFSKRKILVRFHLTPLKSVPALTPAGHFTHSPFCEQKLAFRGVQPCKATATSTSEKINTTIKAPPRFFKNFHLCSPSSFLIPSRFLIANSKKSAILSAPK